MVAGAVKALMAGRVMGRLPWQPRASWPGPACSWPWRPSPFWPTGPPHHASGHRRHADGQVKAIGVATSSYRDEVKPEDFGKAGDAWHADGWLVPIAWVLLEQPLRPREHIGQIAPELPEKYSPLQANGNGNQGV